MTLERLNRQDRVQPPPGLDDDDALAEKLDQLGKRTLVQAEGMLRRGVANLSMLPQQLFAEVENSIGNVAAQPQVKDAIGKFTEVMASVAMLAPLQQDAIEARKTWIPEQLRDRSAVAERDRDDQKLHRDRTQTLSKVASHLGPGSRAMRGRSDAFDISANVSDTLIQAGLAGFEQGAAGAHAAISGSLQNLLRSAEQALGPKNQNELPTAPASDQRNDGELAPQERGEMQVPTGEPEVGSAATVTDRIARDQVEAQEQRATQPEPTPQSAQLEAQAPTLAATPFGFNVGGPSASLSVGASGLSFQGSAGSLQIGSDGVSGSLHTPLGNLNLGPAGVSADLSTGGATLQLDSGGVQLGVRTLSGSLAAGRDGFQFSTAAGSIRSGADGVTGDLENLGAITGPSTSTSAQAATTDTVTPGREPDAATATTGAATPGVFAELTSGLALAGSGAMEPLREAADHLGQIVNASAVTLGLPGKALATPGVTPAPGLDAAGGVAGHKVTATLATDRESHLGRQKESPHLAAISPRGAASGPAAGIPSASASPTAAATTAGHSEGRERPHDGETITDDKAAAKEVAPAAKGATSSELGALDNRAVVGTDQPTSPTRVAIDRTIASHRTVSRDGRSFETPDVSELTRPPSTTPTAAPAGASPPAALAAVPLAAVPHVAGPVTQPSMQLRGQGDSPPTPTAQPLTEASSETMSPVANPNTPGDTENAPHAPPAITPAPLPRATRPSNPTTVAASARGRVQSIKVATPGELQLPANTVPALHLTGSNLPAAPKHAAVSIQAAELETNPQQPVPQIPVAANQSATPEVPTTGAAAPDLPKPPAATAGIPNPAHVQSTVSLSKDRDNATMQLDAESRSQRKIPPATDKQRQTEVVPLGPERERQVPTIETPARQRLTASTERQSVSIDGAAVQGAGSVHKDGSARQAQYHGSAEAHRAQLVNQPAPAVIAATAPATVDGSVQHSQTLVRQVATAAANRPVPALAVSPAVAHLTQNAAMGPLDTSRIQNLDAPRPMPEVNTEAAQATLGTLQTERGKSRAVLDQMRSPQAPQLQVPARNLAAEQEPESEALTNHGGTQPASVTQGPRPRSRAAAVADIESTVAAQAQTQAPGQLAAAGATLADSYQARADSEFQRSQDGLSNASAQAQNQQAQIQSQAPPVTAAQVQAEANQHWSAGQQQSNAATQNMNQQVTQSQGTARTGVQTAQTTRNAGVRAAQTTQQTDNATSQAAYQSDHQGAQSQFQQQDHAAQQAQTVAQQQAQTTAQQRQVQAKTQNDTQKQAAQTQNETQKAQAQAQHQQQVATANQQGQTEQTRIQADGDQQVNQRQTQLQTQTAQLNTQGQQRVNQITQEGERNHNAKIEEGKGPRIRKLIGTT